jgi:hypothetical protein
MNLEFKDKVWKGQFKPTEESAEFEDKLRSAFGLTSRYESAQLLIGRSLAERTPPEPLPSGTKFFRNPLSGEQLFSSDLDLWLCALVLDGKLNPNSAIEDFRALVEAHWARGLALLREELDRSERSEIKLVTHLADLVPEGGAPEEVPFGPAGGDAGEIRLKVGSVSQTHPGGKPVDFVLNGPGTPPHIALMGAVAKGKTTTGVQLGLQIVAKARIAFLHIDPKGEFVADGRVVGVFETLGNAVNGVEVGEQFLPLDFLPRADAPTLKIATAAARLRDTLALCCQSPGDLQKDLLRTAIQDVINDNAEHSLEAINAYYQRALTASGKSPDSIVSRLNELTNIPCFRPQLSPAQFFSRSWVVSLKGLPEELKRLVTLILLDTASAFLLDQPDSAVPGGFRTLRHLLVVDEARKVLQERRSESLVDLVRQGRSKGSVVMLLSQDPSDFDGQADDFLSQIGAVIAFACAQNQRGLRALAGVFGRKVQPNEFIDTYLTKGLAFVKLPEREPERIRCWQPADMIGEGS